MRKSTFKDRLIDCIIVFIMCLVCFVTLYPFLYCLAYSLSNSITVMTKTVTVFPINFTLENYGVVFKNQLILNSFLVSVLRTAAAIVYSLIVTGLASYAISKSMLPGKKILSLILIVPMYISGGLIPYYVLIHDLHLFNNFLVYILPHGFSAFNMLIMKTYFDTLPPGLEESARLDGAGDITIFFRIILPLSMPIVATISMFVGVWHWNSWFDVMLFVNNIKLMPMQTMLQKLLMENFSADLKAQAAQAMGNNTTSPESLKMATIIVSTIPIVCIYPFFQKYFIKGVMIGAVKG